MARLAAILLLVAGLALPVAAQEFPTKTVRIVVAYPPGGPADFAARAFAQKLTDAWKHAVVVENRAGANGNIASQLVAKSAPDGYTVLLHASSLVINPYLYKQPGYDPFKDFIPISLLFDYKLVVVVHPSVPINSVAELVAAAKAKPGSISYASAGGAGAPTHLSVEMFKQIAGIDLLHVPYSGGSPAVADLLAGTVQLMFNNPAQSIQHIKAGKLRGLATTGRVRMPQLPDLPTIAELGYAGYDVGTWFGVWGPAGMPASVVQTFSHAIMAIAHTTEIKELLLGQGLSVIGSSASDLATFERAESERWGNVIKTAKIEPN